MAILSKVYWIDIALQTNLKPQVAALSDQRTLNEEKIKRKNLTNDLKFHKVYFEMCWERKCLILIKEIQDVPIANLTKQIVNINIFLCSFIVRWWETQLKTMEIMNILSRLRVLGVTVLSVFSLVNYRRGGDKLFLWNFLGKCLRCDGKFASARWLNCVTRPTSRNPTNHNQTLWNRRFEETAVADTPQSFCLFSQFTPKEKKNNFDIKSPSKRVAHIITVHNIFIKNRLATLWTLIFLVRGGDTFLDCTKSRFDKSQQ